MKNLIFFGHFGVKNEVIRPMDRHIICIYIQVMMSKIRILIYLKKYIPVLDAIWWKVALKWVSLAASVKKWRQKLFEIFVLRCLDSRLKSGFLYKKVSRITKFKRRGSILGKIIQFEPFRSIKTPFFGREPIRQKLGIFCKILFWVLNGPKTLPVTSWWKIDLKKCLFDPFWPTLIFT